MKQRIFKDIGFAVKKKNLLKAVYSQGKFYTVISGGQVAKLAVIDTTTLDVLKLLDIEGAAGAWAMAAGYNGCIYIGSYYNGHLYRYDPAEDLLEDLGQPVPEQSFIWDIVRGYNKKLFGGTYSGCRVFVINEQTDEIGCLKGRIVEDEEYVRSIAFDEITGKLLIGIASHAHLIEYDIETNNKIDIIPEQYKSKSCVFDINIAAGKIFTIIGNDLLVIDKASQSVESIFSGAGGLSRGVSEPSPDGSCIFFTADNTLYKYDFTQKNFQSLSIDTGDEIVGFGYESGDIGDCENCSLVGLTRDGRLIKYKISSEEYTLSEIPGLPAQPVDIQTIRKGPDGNIYCSGYLLGGMGVYMPERQKLLQHEGIRQVEGMCPIGKKMYFGKYPGAEIFEFDTTARWDMEGNITNPRKLFDLRTGYEQDRTFAMAGIEDKKLLFTGTVPDYGKLGGAFAVYGIDTGSLLVYNNIVKNQSVVSLACSDSKVFGGTSVWGGLGQKPSEEEAKVFVWDITKQEKLYEMVPVTGKKAITALVVAADGNLWGLAEGTLFIFDSVLHRVVHTAQLFPVSYSSCGHLWRDAFLENGKDDNIYGIIGFPTAGGKFFRINIWTKELTILGNMNFSGMTKDNYGDFYFIDGKRLLKAEM